MIDTRPAVEFEAGHLRGALNLPLRELGRRNCRVAARLSLTAGALIACSPTKPSPNYEGAASKLPGLKRGIRNGRLLAYR